MSLKGGKAEEHRAPVRDFVQLLLETQELVLDLGRHFYGTEVPEEVIEKSCQVNIVGLSYGSVIPELELDDLNAIGLKAFEEACRAFSVLRDPAIAPVSVLGPEAISRIGRMGTLLDHGYSHIEVAYVQDGQTLLTGTLDQELRGKILEEHGLTIHVEGVTVQGLLYQLEDRPSAREKTSFNAELLDEAGKIWSVRFKQGDVERARQLWKRPVQLTGTASYSPVRRPLLLADGAEPVTAESWEQAIARYRGAWKDLYRGMSFDEIVEGLR